MATVEGIPTVSLTMRIKISESEARALEALAGYGDDAFVKAFYEKLGESYMKKHETGLRSFLKSIREFMPGYLSRADKARETFSPCVPSSAQLEGV
jgi:hypothetical protein